MKRSQAMQEAVDCIGCGLLAGWFSITALQADGRQVDGVGVLCVFQGGGLQSMHEACSLSGARVHLFQLWKVAGPALLNVLHGLMVLWTIMSLLKHLQPFNSLTGQKYNYNHAKGPAGLDRQQLLQAQAVGPAVPCVA